MKIYNWHNDYTSSGLLNPDVLLKLVADLTDCMSSKFGLWFHLYFPWVCFNSCSFHQVLFNFVLPMIFYWNNPALLGLSFIRKEKRLPNMSYLTALFFPVKVRKVFFQACQFLSFLLRLLTSMEMALCCEFLFHSSTQKWVTITLLYLGHRAAIHSEWQPAICFALKCW